MTYNRKFWMVDEETLTVRTVTDKEAREIAGDSDDASYVSMAVNAACRGHQLFEDRDRAIVWAYDMNQERQAKQFAQEN